MLDFAVRKDQHLRSVLVRGVWNFRSFLTKKTDKAFIAGDFNSLDKHFPKIWEKLLVQFEVTDVNPDLITYRHAGGGSTLDRCLVPEALISSAKLHSCATVLISHVAQGHDILKLRVNVRRNVLNNPRRPKHEVIPSGVFVPSKDGTPVHSTSELQDLVRLLHREHGRLYVSNGAVSPQPTLPFLHQGCLPPCSNADNRTGRCSPHGWLGAGQNGPLNCSLSAYLGSHLSIVACFWS